jgi:hypothetical protein
MTRMVSVSAMLMRIMYVCLVDEASVRSRRWYAMGGRVMAVLGMTRRMTLTERVDCAVRLMCVRSRLRRFPGAGSIAGGHPRSPEQCLWSQFRPSYPRKVNLSQSIGVLER